MLARLHIALVALIASFAAASPALAQDFHDNVVIILDTSCSMDSAISRGSPQSKMASAQQALRQVLQSLPPTTRIGLLTFEDEWAYPLSERDDVKLVTAVNQTRPSGGTPLGVYLKKGADALLKAREEEFGYGTYRLLVVTDGQASDEAKMAKYAPEVVQRGITMDVIGVAMSEDHALQRLANSYRRADDPDSLVQAVQEILAEVSTDPNDMAGADVFEAIDGLPDGFALVLLQQLSTSGNHPIGTKPKQKPGPTGRDSKSEAVVGSPSPTSSDCSHGPGLPLAALAMLPLFLARRDRPRWASRP